MTEKIKRLLYVFNVVYAIFGLITSCVGLWFYVVLSDFLALRNIDHYLLDFRVYWIQIVPWAFFILGLTALILGFCGLFGANKRNKLVIQVYCVFLILLIILQMIVAILIFIYVDSDYTDGFVKDTVYDGFYNTASNPGISKAFNIIERQYNCCGANDARDYRSFRDDLPSSCCIDVFGIPCEFTDEEPNERLGCAEVVAFYTKVVSSVVAGISILVCLVEAADVYLACKLLNKFRKTGR